MLRGPTPAELAVDGSEDSPEEEQVTNADALLAKVTLSSSDLTERRAPTPRSSADVPPKVRIEVGAEVAALPPARECGDDLAEVSSTPSHVAVADPRPPVRYWESDHRAVGEDRAGAAAGAGVEALSTQDQPQWVSRCCQEVSSSGQSLGWPLIPLGRCSRKGRSIALSSSVKLTRLKRAGRLTCSGRGTDLAP